jgi:quercetin dioxygenase-like cupin family protein
MSDFPSASVRPTLRSAQILLPCANFDASLAFFTEQLGFRVDLIFPADAPETAVISGYGVSLRLEAAASSLPIRLRLLCDALPPGLARVWHSPDGSQIELQDYNPAMFVPDGPQEFIISRASANWHSGRAGLQYRDLIPGRLGGRFVASHIRVPAGGPVPDYVHFHKVRFQMIFCKSGWVKVVYEDQGPPFVMQAGDCVLQPPEIRHRVLEASTGMEVVEVGCPAIHETIADHKLALPTGQVLPARDFGGQRFVRHIANDASWQAWRIPGWQARDIGIAAATDGLAGVQVVRPLPGAGGAESITQTATPSIMQSITHQGEFLFWFVLAGELSLTSRTLGQHTLYSGDSCTIPDGSECTLSGSDTLEVLEVRLPG